MRFILKKFHLIAASYFNPINYIFFDKSHTVLDVGCGSGTNALLLKMRRPKCRFTGIEIHGPSVKEARLSGVYENVIQADLFKHLSVREKYDTVICLQVLEHLPKKRALQLLSEMETAAEKQVIITSPIGEIDQGEIDNNQWQTHQSSFVPEAFIRRGYKIKTIGRKLLSSQEGIQGTDYAWFIKAVCLSVDVLLTPVYWLFPSLADHYFVAYKLMNK